MKPSYAVILAVIGALAGFIAGRTTHPQSRYVYTTFQNTYPERTDVSTGATWIAYGGAWHQEAIAPAQLLGGTPN